MREIKFRAWDVYGKKMHAVKEISWNDERPMDGLLNDNEGGLFRAYLNEDCLVDGKYPEYFILMQFIGLHDKNGTPIYEGDILQPIFVGRKKSLYEVCWDKGSASFYLKPLWKEEGGYLLYRNGEGYSPYEVIGNIYENKEDIK